MDRTQAIAQDPGKGGDAFLPGTNIKEEDVRHGKVAPDQLLKNAKDKDADVALKAFANYQEQVTEIDEATNKRLLRKIDWNLMPVCFLA